MNHTFLFHLRTIALAALMLLIMPSQAEQMDENNVPNAQEITNTTPGQVLTTGTYIVNTNLSINANTSDKKNALEVAAGANVVLIINENMTLNVIGKNANETIGAGAAIRVPEGASLTIQGKGTLKAQGGHAANGEDGEKGGNGHDKGNEGDAGPGGYGGKGGGGAGAAIGGNGGDGGARANGAARPSSSGNHNGNAGAAGNPGMQGEKAGRITIDPSVHTDLKSGHAGQYGNGGAGGDSDYDETNDNEGLGGGGGGAGGAGGTAAPWPVGDGGDGGASGGGGGSGGHSQTSGFYNAGFAGGGGGGKSADGNHNGANGANSDNLHGSKTVNGGGGGAAAPTWLTDANTPEWVTYDLCSDTWASHTEQPATNSQGEYQLTKPEHLAWIVWHQMTGTVDYQDKTIWLMNDLDMGRYAWSAAKPDHQLKNIRMDGQGHTIRNLHTVPKGNTGDELWAGLFPRIQAADDGDNNGHCTHLDIRNLELENVYMYGRSAGSLIGYTAIESLNLANIVVRNATVTPMLNDTIGTTGGLIATIDFRHNTVKTDPVIQYCSVEGLVANQTASYATGGLIGEVSFYEPPTNSGDYNAYQTYRKTLTIQHCATNVVLSSHSKQTAGIVGITRYWYPNGKPNTDNAYTRVRLKNCMVANMPAALQGNIAIFNTARTPNFTAYPCDTWSGYAPKTATSIKTVHPLSAAGNNLSSLDNVQRTLSLTDPTNINLQEALKIAYESTGNADVFALYKGQIVALEDHYNNYRQLRPYQIIDRTGSIQRIVMADGSGYTYEMTGPNDPNQKFYSQPYVRLEMIRDAQRGLWSMSDSLNNALVRLGCTTIQLGDWKGVCLPTDSARHFTINSNLSGIYQVPIVGSLNGYVPVGQSVFILYWSNKGGSFKTNHGHWVIRKNGTMVGTAPADHTSWCDESIFTNDSLNAPGNRLGATPTVSPLYEVAWVDEGIELTEQDAFFQSFQRDIENSRDKLEYTDLESGDVQLSLSLAASDFYQDGKLRFYRHTVTVSSKNEIVLLDTTAIGDEITLSFTTDDKRIKQKEYKVLYKGGFDICSNYRFSARVTTTDNKDDWAYSSIYTPSTSDSILSFTASKGEYEDHVRIKGIMRLTSENVQVHVVRRRVDFRAQQEGINEERVIYSAVHTKSDPNIQVDDPVMPGYIYEYFVALQLNCGGNFDSRMPIEFRDHASTGFASSLGQISGRITYKSSNGTRSVAAQNINVMLAEPESNGSSILPHLALTSDGQSGYVMATDSSLNKHKQDWTAQCHIKPNYLSTDVTSAARIIYTLPSGYSLTATRLDNGSHPAIALGIQYRDSATHTLIQEQSSLALDNQSHVLFRHIVLSKQQNNLFIGAVQHRLGNADTLLWSQPIAIQTAMPSDTLYLLNDTTGRNGFVGSMDEFRLWKGALTSEQIMGNYNHYLTGMEDNLMLYYPFDEGIDTHVFDHQHVNNEWRNITGIICHRSNANRILLEEVNDSQELTAHRGMLETSLAARGTTNSQGEYTIAGIAYAGAGTNYKVKPSYGTHTFNPAYVHRTVSNRASVYTGVDFEDESSFDVSIKAYYALGTLPAEGLTVLIDGVSQNNNEGIIRTDINGEATVSVPVGKHRISVMAPNHIMLNPYHNMTMVEGLPCRSRSVDAQGNVTVVPYSKDSLVDVQSHITNPLIFYDNTYVKVIGRVVGGDVEGNRQMAYHGSKWEGYRCSRANIGQAELVFIPTYDKTGAASYVSDSHNEYIQPNEQFYLEDTLGVGDSIYVNSQTIYRPGQKGIHVLTDPRTGEYVAYLPPVRMRLDGDSSVLVHYPADRTDRVLKTEVKRTAQEPFVVDLSQPNSLQRDSILLDSSMFAGNDKVYHKDSLYIPYTYHKRLNIVRYAEQPNITLEDYMRKYKPDEKNQEPSHLLGESYAAYTYKREDDPTQTLRYDTIPFINGDNYVAGDTQGHYPVFFSGNIYSLVLSLNEIYDSYDRGLTHDTVPLRGATVTAYNGWAVHKVTCDTLWMDSTACSKKTDTELRAFTYMLEPTKDGAKKGSSAADGCVSIAFVGGYPSEQYPYTNTFSIDFDYHGNIRKWPETPLPGLVLGSVPIPGTSFVTLGPDEVDYVLSDPPGTNSYAYIDKGSSFSVNYNTDISTGIGYEYTSKAGTGTGVDIASGLGVIQRVFKAATNVTLGSTSKANFATVNGVTKTVTYTIGDRISTSSGEGYVGARGDVYIGRATNLFYTKTKEITTWPGALPSDQKGYRLQSKVQHSDFAIYSNLGASVDQKSKTIFNYTQYHVLNELFPELKNRRRAYLESYRSDMAAATSHKDSTANEAKYYPKRQQMDYTADKWTKDVDYVIIYGKNDNEDKFVDRIQQVDEAITRWKDEIRNHERRKAFNFNPDSVKAETGSAKEEITVRELELTDIYGHPQKYDPSVLVGVNSTANGLGNILFGIATGDWIGMILSGVNAFVSGMAAGLQDRTLEKPVGFIGNYSHDSGAPISHSATIAMNFSRTNKQSHQGTQGFNMNSNTTLQPAGVNTKWEVHRMFQFNSTTNYGSSKTETNNVTFGYNLSTAGLGAYQSVDVYLPIEPKKNDEKPKNTQPFIFKLRGGQSKCPVELPDSTTFYRDPRNNEPVAISAGAIALVRPAIELIDVSQNVIGLPSGETSTFKVRLLNNSAATSDIAYDMLLMVDPTTNPDGLQFSIAGNTDINDEPGYDLRLKPNQSATLNIQVQQSNPEVTRYDSILLILRSDCGARENKTTQYVSFQFSESSSPVNLSIDKDVVNSLSPKIGMTLSGYQPNYKRFAGMYIQARRLGSTDDWQNLYLVVNHPELCKNIHFSKSDTIRNSATSFYCQVPFDDKDWIDGQYEVRAAAFSYYSQNETYTYSNVFTITKDTSRPIVLGTPEPTNGVLGYNQHIMLTFNEDTWYQRASETNFDISVTLNDEVLKNHAVAMNFHHTNPAYTEHDMNLFGGRDFTLGMWFKPININEKCVLFAQKMDAGQLLSFGYDKGYLYLQAGPTTYRSNSPAVMVSGKPEEGWSYVLLQYEKKTHTVFARIFTDNQPGADACILRVEDLPLADMQQGPIYVGATPQIGSALGMFQPDGNVSIHDLSLWSGIIERDYITMHSPQSTKVLSDQLIGYWRADKLYQSYVEDVAYARHLHLPSASCWFTRQPNFSLPFSGEQVMVVENNDGMFQHEDDYLLAFWYKASEVNNRYVLFKNVMLHQQDSALTDSMLFYIEQSHLCLQVNGRTYQLGKAHQNTWQHVALEYVGNGYSNVHLDGQVVATINSDYIPAFRYLRLAFGGDYQQYADATGKLEKDSVRYGFKGNMDDIVLAAGRFTRNSIINLASRQHLGNRCVFYFPFQKPRADKLDDADEVLYNRADTARVPYQPTYLGFSGTSEITSTDGPLQLAEQITRQLAPNEYSVTKSDRQYAISFIDKLAEQLEGQRLYITAHEICDVYGNPQVNHSWDVLVKQEFVRWEPRLTEVTLEEGESTLINLYLTKNRAGIDLTISGEPHWLHIKKTVDEYDYMNFDAEVTTENLSPGVYYAYLSASYDGKSVQNVIKLTVLAMRPDWEVDPTTFTNSMNMIADLTIEGKPIISEDVLLGAFIGNKCHGLCSMTYNEARNRTIAFLTIYGDNGKRGKPIEFKAWTPTSGVIYPQLVLKDNNNDSVSPVYVPDKVLGTFNAPYHLIGKRKIQHDVLLGLGYNWVSTYVQPTSSQLSQIVAPISANLTYMMTRLKGTKVISDSTLHVTPNEMFILCVNRQLGIEQTLSVYGQALLTDTTQITLHGIANGTAWSWIGYPCQRKQSLHDALSFLTPHEGDIIKSQRAFATWVGNAWLGSLETLTPGQGYMYGNTAGHAVSFHYASPILIDEAKHMPGLHAPAMEDERSTNTSRTHLEHITYPYNMVVIAQVVDAQGNTIENATVTAVVNSETRGVSEPLTNNDEPLQTGALHGLVIAGDQPATVQFVIQANGEMWTAEEQLSYSSNAVEGTILSPFVLHPAAGDQVTKFIHDGHVYILRAHQLYDATGAEVGTK